MKIWKIENKYNIRGNMKTYKKYINEGKYTKLLINLDVDDTKEIEAIMRDMENLNSHLNKMKTQFFRKRPSANRWGKEDSRLYDILSSHEFLGFRNDNRNASDLLDIGNEI